MTIEVLLAVAILFITSSFGLLVLWLWHIRNAIGLHTRCLGHLINERLDKAIADAQTESVNHLQ